MVNDWNRIILLLKLQIGRVNIPALFIGWGIIAVLSFLCFRGNKHRNGKWITAFLLYCWFIVGMTLLRVGGNEEQEAINLSLNFGSILFWVKGGRRQMVYSLLNVLLFVPFGYLLRRMLHSGKKVLLIGGCGLLCSAVIEVLQLIFGLGVFELMDLIANSAGALLGAIVFDCFWSRKIRK